MPDWMELSMHTSGNALLTPTQVADRLGVSPNTLAVWRCCKRYPLAYVKVGTRVRYRTEDVDRFVQGQVQPC